MPQDLILFCIIFSHSPLRENVLFWKNSLFCFSWGFSLSWLVGGTTGLICLSGCPWSHPMPHRLCYLNVDYVSCGTIPVRTVVRPDMYHLEMDKFIFNKGFFFKSTSVILVCKGKIYSVEESSVYFTEIPSCVHFTRPALYQCFLYQDTLLTLPAWA